MKTFAPALAATFLLAACGGGASQQQQQQAPGPAPVGVITVQYQPVTLTTELPGRTSAYETSEVRPQVNGIVTARLFQEGDFVAKGQPLYRIDPAPYQAQVASARAALSRARAALSSSRALARRYGELVGINAISRQEFENATTQAQQAQADVAAQQAALRSAQIDLARTTIRAPIAGRIGRSTYTTGALVTAAQTEPLTTIQRLDPIFVDMQQSSAALVALRRGRNGTLLDSVPVRLKLEDGSDYPLAGRVQFAEAVVDGNTGTVTLRARFPNPQGLLLPGMYVRARFDQSIARNAVLAPQQGVSRDAKGRATVVLVGPGNKAVLRDVTADRTVGDKWLVTAGLKPGDKLIVEGLGRIKPGQAIKPVPAGSKPTPPPAAKGDAKSGSGRAG